MKITTSISLLLTIIVLLLTSCNTDFELYKDYKDVSIVYCIADISDDTTWVKITKAFNGPGNALILAQNPDSSNYPYKLDAVIVGKKNGVSLEPMILDTITIHNKAITDTIIDNNGDTVILNPFYSPDQLLYYTTGKLDEDTDYSLTIKKNNGDSVSASTGLVSNIEVIEPARFIHFNISKSGDIKWVSAKNGSRYMISMRFNYKEYAPGYIDTIQEYVDFFSRSVNAYSENGGDNMEVTYHGADFFSTLEAELPNINNVERWAGNVDLKIICGSKVLITYLDINSAIGNTLEEVPIYSNIDGGTGIFASRHTILLSLPLSVSAEYNLILHYDLGFVFK